MGCRLVVHCYGALEMRSSATISPVWPSKAALAAAPPTWYASVSYTHLCDDEVLKNMNRRGGRKEIEDAIRRLRAAIPNITLRRCV